MKRTIPFLLMALVIIAGCKNRQQMKEPADAAGPSTITTEQFTDAAPGLVDKPVLISGTVTHVCKHGGQRLFITGENPEQPVKITTGKDIAEFDISLEGSTITISGILKELVIDEAYLAAWEAGLTGEEEGTGGMAEERPGEHEHAAGTGTTRATPGTEAEMEGELSAADQIMNYRKKIAASGKDHLSEYWIEAQSFSFIDD